LYQNGLLDRNVNRLIDTKGMNRISGIPCLILEGIRPFQFRESEQLFFGKQPTVAGLERIGGLIMEKRSSIMNAWRMSEWNLKKNCSC
jgi:hypothetical protein